MRETIDKLDDKITVLKQNLTYTCFENAVLHEKLLQVE